MADELSQEIITYFVQKQKGAEELSKEKADYLSKLSGLFNNPYVLKLMEETNQSVTLFEYNKRGGHYSLVANSQGQLVNRVGVNNVTERIENLPLYDLNIWDEMYPYGSTFSNDWTFNPDENEINILERKIRDLMNK
ncbi:hypothetical protein HN385_05325 [archaeon]|jgi:hypothetical protein|nr:hypothetical protein [archaeon]MBT3451503.1 hypothetical protein [archaeon]MBT6869496.1 hypothetical protein [archaeon]MBT7193184.1 hypothetical protein [archaeon]MBT7380490.1 hypothetical protein [archaeon]